MGKTTRTGPIIRTIMLAAVFIHCTMGMNGHDGAPNPDDEKSESGSPPTMAQGLEAAQNASQQCEETNNDAMNSQTVKVVDSGDQPSWKNLGLAGDFLLSHE